MLGPKALAMIARSPELTTVFASTDAISRPSPQPSPSLSATVGLVPYALYSTPSLMPSPSVSAFNGSLPIVASNADERPSRSGSSIAAGNAGFDSGFTGSEPSAHSAPSRTPSPSVSASSGFVGPDADGHGRPNASAVSGRPSLSLSVSHTSPTLSDIANVRSSKAKRGCGSRMKLPSLFAWPGFGSDGQLSAQSGTPSPSLSAPPQGVAVARGVEVEVLVRVTVAVGVNVGVDVAVAESKNSANSLYPPGLTSSWLYVIVIDSP